MKMKWFCASMVMALLFGVAAVHADDAVPTLVSDKGDYAPYETVLLTATGFVPGEEVDLSISIEDPVTGEVIADYAWAVESTDADGGLVTTYEVPPEAAWMTLHATAVGLQSQRVALLTFTDAVGVTSSSIVASGNVVTASVTFQSGATSASGHIVGFTAGFVPFTATSDPKTWTYTFTGTCASTYTLQSVKYNSAGGAITINNRLATTDACPPPPPVVVCIPNTRPVLNAHNLALGSVVGCLQNGQLVFTKSLTAADFGATATDVDAITDDNPTGAIPVYVSVDSVTLVGPGVATAVTLSVFALDVLPDNDPSCDVEDPQDPSQNVTVTATINYTVNGFLSPLSQTATTIVKLGSTVPVKFTLSDCSGNPITTNLGAADHTIEVLYCSAANPDGTPTVTDAGASNSNGVAFRYSATDGWIYNLQTKTGYTKGCTYKIRATLNSGQTICSLITIK